MMSNFSHALTLMRNQMAMKRATVIMATSGNEDGGWDVDSYLFVCLFPTYDDVVNQVVS